MKEITYIIGHKNPDTDSVCAAIALARFKNTLEGGKEFIPARAGELNPETKFVLEKFNIPEPMLLENAEGKNLILVDHNESGQVIEGVNKAEVFEVIDHHKIGDFQSKRPIMYHAEPIGSTCSIIADFYFYHNVDLSKEIAGILLASILSDTVILRSPTTTEKDRKFAEKLAEITGLDIESFGLEVKKVNASIKGKTARDIIMGDFKQFSKNDFKYGIGQIEVVLFDEVLEHKSEILAELNKVKSENSLNLVVLMITNIVEESSKIWYSGDDNFIEKAFKQKPEDKQVYLEKWMSRKKQTVPAIESAL